MKSRYEATRDSRGRHSVRAIQHLGGKCGACGFSNEVALVVEPVGSHSLPLDLHTIQTHFAQFEVLCLNCRAIKRAAAVAWAYNKALIRAAKGNAEEALASKPSAAATTQAPDYPVSPPEICPY